MSQEKDEREDRASQMDDEPAVTRMGEAHQRILSELGRVIVGQAQVIDELMIAIFSSRAACSARASPSFQG